MRLADALIRRADRLTFTSGSETQADLRESMRARASRVGGAGWLLRDLAGLSAFRATGPSWTLVFAGSDEERLKVERMFFPRETVVWEALGRIPLVRLAAHTRRWLKNGVDLVVSEVSGLLPHARGLDYSFSVPLAIDHVLWLPAAENLETLLTGSRMKGVRSDVRKAERAGYSFRVSHEMADYERFYHEMYLPHMRARHGALAHAAAVDGYLLNAFRRGGLIFAMVDGAAVAGQIWFVNGGAMHQVEMGILGGDPALMKQGLSHVLDWYCWHAALAAGATRIEMGRSPAHCADGVFTYKTAWGPELSRAKYVYGTRHFCAERLSPALQAHINQLGLITETPRGFGRVVVDVAEPSQDARRTHEILADAVSRRLAGLVMLAPGRTTLMLDPRPA